MIRYYLPLSTTRLHHQEVYQLVARTLEDFKVSALKSKDEEFTRLLNQLKTKTPLFHTALEQIRAHEKSRLLHSLDIQRDQAFRALSDSVRLLRYSSVAAEKSAYQSMMLLLKQYKGLTAKHYEEETAMITHLLTRLASPEYATSVTTLNMTRFVTALTTAQAAFELQYSARSKDLVGKTPYNVHKVRKELLYDYQLFIDYVGMNATVKSDPFYKQVVALINHNRKYYADVLVRRFPKDKTTLSTTKVSESTTTNNTESVT